MRDLAKLLGRGIAVSPWHDTAVEIEGLGSSASELQDSRRYIDVTVVKVSMRDCDE